MNLDPRDFAAFETLRRQLQRGEQDPKPARHFDKYNESQPQKCCAPFCLCREVWNAVQTFRSYIGLNR